MKYKESAISPEYGRVFGFDINGKQIQDKKIYELEKAVCKIKSNDFGEVR